ncbi:MAG: hypothetical protein J1E02_07420 [Coprobacter sp.]|nr:hypothetical protein [Coprobacter sp.]
MENNTKEKTFLQRAVTILLILSSISLVLTLYSIYKQEETVKNIQQIQEKQDLNAHTSQEFITYIDSINHNQTHINQASEESEKQTQEKARLKTLMTKVLKDAYAAFPDPNDEPQYFMTDLDGDKIPELWVTTGTSTADSKLDAYVNNNGNLKKITTEEGVFNCTYHIGKNYVLLCYGHMGFGGWYKLTINNGKIKKECIFEEELGDDEYEYSKPKEPCIQEYNVSDLSLLDRFFQ